ncbi:MAG: hypothetical protein Kow0029_27070 [Candidatus Rifleibacteriota bacterium]
MFGNDRNNNNKTSGGKLPRNSYWKRLRQLKKNIIEADGSEGFGSCLRIPELFRHEICKGKFSELQVIKI